MHLTGPRKAVRLQNEGCAWAAEHAYQPRWAWHMSTAVGQTDSAQRLDGLLAPRFGLAGKRTVPRSEERPQQWAVVEPAGGRHRHGRWTR